MFYLLVLISCLSMTVYCDYNKLVFTECVAFGQGLPAINMTHFDITPMPIKPPMKINLSAKANLLRQVRGKLKTSVYMTRIVASLRLPVKCYLINGIYVGSCDYEDLCSFVLGLTRVPEVKYVLLNLFKSFFDFEGDSLTCPITTKVTSVEINQEIDLPDISKTALSVFMSGDYEVSVLVNDSIGTVGCWTIKYTMK